MSTYQFEIPERDNAPRIENAVADYFSRMGFCLVGWSTKRAGFVRWEMSRQGHSKYEIETRVNVSAQDADFPLEIIDAAVLSGLQGEVGKPNEQPIVPVRARLQNRAIEGTKRKAECRTGG